MTKVESLESQSREHLLKLATRAAMSVATILVIAKVIAWWYSGSVALLGSLVDSLMDTLVSLVNFFAVRYAIRPADDDHRFGHGKVEAVASLFQSLLIVGSSIFLLQYAIDRLMNPRPVEHETAAILVMCLSLALTSALVVFQRRIIAKTNSTVIAADSLHYFTDLLGNAAVIIALIASVYGFQNVDAVIGVAIAIYIAYSAWEIARDAIDLLLDKELDDETREKIDKAIRSVKGVHGYHDLRTRDSGGVVFVQLHLELPDKMYLIDSHRIADEVEAKISALFDKAEVLVHQDPTSVVPESHPIVED